MQLKYCFHLARTVSLLDGNFIFPALNPISGWTDLEGHLCAQEPPDSAH